MASKDSDSETDTPGVHISLLLVEESQIPLWLCLRDPTADHVVYLDL